MINIVVACHGRLAEGLIDAMQLIAGPQPGVCAVQLGEEDSIEEFEGRVEAALQERQAGDSVLVLADLFGASPFNVSAKLAAKLPDVEVITGVNLGMLLETALNREGASLAELTAIGRGAGTAGVKVLSELMREE